MTSPEQHPGDPDHEAGVLGSTVAPPGDEESGGARPGPGGGQAGPSHPPAQSEPDAHRRSR